MRQAAKRTTVKSLAALALLATFAQPAAADPFGTRAGTEAILAKAERVVGRLLGSLERIFQADGTDIETDA